MTAVPLLNRAEVKRLLEVDPLLGALEDAFVALSAGRTSVPPRVAARTPAGLLGAMPGYLPDVALVVKLVTVFSGNEGGELPSHQGLIVLFDDETGAPLAVMDAIHITAVRTGAASAVAVRHLAREDARVLAILGAGVQGGSHLETVTRVREFEEVRIASRTRAHAEALAARDPRARVAAGFEEAVRGADVVCCCTDAPEPILRRDWLGPGTHVGSVGGTRGPELDAATVAEARVFVEWRGAAVHPPPAGAAELQAMDPGDVTELGEVLSGDRPGRRSEEEVTVYKSTGHAVEDAAAARLVLDRAVERGGGRHVEL